MMKCKSVYIYKQERNNCCSTDFEVITFISAVESLMIDDNLIDEVDVHKMWEKYEKEIIGRGFYGRMI